MKHLRRLFAVASAAFFFATAALAQTSGTVTNHAFVLGKGAGATGYTSLLCGSAQLAVGQTAADPICKTITGDWTLSAAGAAAIGATKVTSAMLNADVFSTAHSWAGQQTFVAPILGTPASGIATNLTGTAAGLTAGLATTVTTNANLTGDVTSVGNASTIGAHKVTRAMQAQGVARSVIGVTGNGAADVADIQGTANQFLGVNSAGTALAFNTLSQDCSLATGVITCTKTNNVSFATSATTDTTSASNISAGTLPVARLNATISPQLRITLNTATPVMLTNYTGQTTVYVTPYTGNLIPIYDGTNMVPTPFAEVSQATTDTTKSPAAVAASSNYDIFCWIDSGTNRCTRGPVWTNLTSRSAGTALVRVSGVLLNSVSITNGPAASRGTYMGTISSDASSQINWIFGGVSAGCTAAVFGVWNMYNRVDVKTFIGNSTASWTYTVANTIREIAGSTTCAVGAVRGLDEDGVTAAYNAIALAGATTNMSNGIGLNSTTAFVGTPGYCASTAVAFNTPGWYSGLMGLGYNTFTANERQDTTTLSTWFGLVAASLSQTGMHVGLKQ